MFGGLLAVLFTACKKSGPTELKIDEPPGYWRSQGFVEMVPPIRLPGRKHRRDRVEVWLKVPEGSQIGTRYVPALERHVLTYPPGTVADRVEYRARGKDRASWQWSVADVRGTRLREDGEFFHAYRPTTARVHSPLRGFEWKRGDRKSWETATEHLVEMVSALSSAAHRDRVTAAARRNNECAGCHEHARPDNTVKGEHGLVNRGTDGAGFFLVQSVLSDRAPLETYFPVEQNTEDPFIRFVCGPGETPIHATPGKRPTCPEGEVPVAVLDVPGALKAGDSRVAAICQSRRYLFSRMDTASRQVFHKSFEECGIVADP